MKVLDQVYESAESFFALLLRNGRNLEENFLGHNHNDEHDPIGHVHTAYEPLFASKSVDETVNNSATLQDDNHLGIVTPVSKSWYVTACIMFNSSTTADFKLRWIAPAGATFSWNTATSPPQTLASVLTVDGTGADAVVMVHGIFTTGPTTASPFGLQLQWAQNSAEVSDTIVRAGSWMLMREL